MFQVMENGIYESPAQMTTTNASWTGDSVTGGDRLAQGTTWYPAGDYYPWGVQPIYWNNYPVYICSDKTKKAIEVLKALQADKVLTCNSVPRFIELVEKISGLL